ncbi:MAG: hypothetical protein KIS92_26690, partial [Planctomycetota bacterium]|nr:hypothetical protein [Planctomycetota bacterium]
GAERTRIDFETAPDGSALTPGMDVGKTFVAKGFAISTSIEGSIVSVNNYNVQGRSNGNSCATHQPLWEGSLTIRFCVPGRPGIPAGVTRAGLWIAAVMADGTALEAYDARGKRIAEIKTTRGPNEFLGVRSRVPIACLKVVPNPNIDPNYTIDDLVFDAPRPLDAFGHPDLLSVRFPSGERVLCRAARVTEGSLEMDGLSIGVERLARSFAPGTRVLTALKDQKAGDPPKGCWVRLAEGSTLRAASEDGLACVRAPRLALSPANVCVLWSDAKGCFEFDAKQAPKMAGGGDAFKLSPAGTADGAAIVFGLDQGKDGPLPFKAATFEKDLGLRGGDAAVRVAYDQAPCVWLHPAKDLPAEAARVNLVNGETLALRCPANPDAAFSFVSFGPEGAVVKQGTYEVRIALAEVASVVAP